uniref:Uncharacterized protein n=1 Tax=Acrobeloides nanus TaxID=290746 RepID=A0A914CYT3_9BILA
ILSWILNVLDEGNLKDKLKAIYDKGQYSFAFLDIEECQPHQRTKLNVIIKNFQIRLSIETKT